MNRQQSRLIGATLAAAAAAFAARCGSSSPANTSDSAATAAPAASYFSVPPDRLAHVHVVPVTKGTWATTLHTTGTVDWDNDHTTQVFTQVSGVVTRLMVDTGAVVKENDPLLYVTSPDMANAVATYRKAKNRLDLAQRTLDRSKDLLDHKAIAQRDFESVQADFNDASTDVENALDALKIFGVMQSELDDAQRQNVPVQPELALRAPIAGTVVQKLVLPGQLIQAGSTMAFVISNVSTVWIQGHVYEKDLTSVHVGDQADAETSAFPTVFRGEVTYIDRLVDPTTRTTLVRIVTSNAGALLKKDLFVDVTIHDKASRNVVSVPVAAVLYDDQDFPYVYAQVSSGKFAVRLVKLGAQQNDQVEILDGLKDTDQVVAEGSLFLQFANTVGQQ